MAALRAPVAMATQAAVRQRVMADNTFSCWRLIHLRLRSTNDGPAERTISATSSGGRVMLAGWPLRLLG